MKDDGPGPSRERLSEPGLRSLFWIFFKIACTSFGGFMAMIAVVQNVVVERRKLLSSADMADGISLASILPGPVAVNLVAYVGYRLRGAAGAAVSAIAIVLPSLTLILLLSVAYFRYGQVPAVSRLFLGFIPAMTAIILAAAWNMARKSVTNLREAILVVTGAVVLLVAGGVWSTLGIVLGAGVLGSWWFRERSGPADSPPAPAVPVPPRPGDSKLHAVLPFVSTAAPLLSVDPGLLAKIFFTFGGMSLMLFGGAYVFIPLIQEVVVEGHGWVSQQEFIDAVAMGQVTPGPILVSAAFVGLKIAGLAGALAATLGIYLPSALLMIASSRVLEHIKRSAVIRSALRGVRPAVVGMIFAAGVVIGKTAAPVWVSVAIFAVSLLALLRFRIEAVWIIPAAGGFGWLFY
ncbi:MAG TPA: chromate transporter [Gammaproteobacteria bacterium]|nr:chromate transporter [Gammaproteobacteria bacterium]